MANTRNLYPYHLTPGGPDLTRRLVRRAVQRISSSEKTDASLKQTDASLEQTDASLEQTDTSLKQTDMSLLLAGCRYGENLIGLLDTFKGSLTGIEEDSEAVFFAKMAAMQLGLGKRCSFRYMSPLTMDFDAQSFDIIVLEGIFSSYPAARALKDARRVLKPGGVIMISDSFWKLESMPSYVHDVWEAEERRIFTEHQLGDLFEEAELELAFFEIRRNALNSFYEQFTTEIKSITKADFEGMKHQKSLVKHYKHEIDVYLKHGGEKYMGYFTAMVTAATTRS